MARGLVARLRDWLAGPADLDDLEDLLLEGDFGPRLADQIVEQVRGDRPRDWAAMRAALQRCLLAAIRVATVAPPPGDLHVVLVLGVNGVGKTTSLAKLARHFGASHQVMLGAADTFRAAAGEQLAVHGERLAVPVVRQQRGADPAAVVYDALDSAASRGCNLLLVDTAGRMHNRQDLVRELQKLARVVGGKVPRARIHHLLVIDATTGQNALEQARVFGAAIGVDSVLLAKFDASARGGTAFAVSSQLQLPFSFLGTGEGLDDLEPFVADRFVAAVLDEVAGGRR